MTSCLKIAGLSADLAINCRGYARTAITKSAVVVGRRYAAVVPVLLVLHLATNLGIVCL